jgi:hypothetical protein
VDDVNENYLLRAPKKGKLIKGPNWTAYKRENLGIIPRKTENVLIIDKNMKAPKGFNSRCERFLGRADSVKNCYPGPGAYEKGDSELTRPSTSFSSKGYCNGFISATDRFDEPKMYYSKYYPGPGQYKLDQKISICSEINKNIQYKSLYEKTSVKSLKIKQDNPGPGFYNPENLSETTKIPPLSAFKSSVDRFKKTSKTALPGPGKYFKEIIEDIDKKRNTQSYFFKKPQEKKEDPLKKYIDVNVNNEKEVDRSKEIATKLKIKQVHSEIKSFPFHVHTTYESDLDNKFTNFNLNIEVENLLKPNKKEINSAVTTRYKSGMNFRNSTVRNRDLSAQPFKLNKTEILPIKQLNTQENQIINSIFAKSIKKDIFALSPSRWNSVKGVPIPGPAFYNPKNSPKKSDFFNKNETRWL